jgi:DNA mismatch repair ATPase MutS
MTEERETGMSEKEIWDYVWGYFQVHAAQRLTTFNFYIALSTIVTTGLFATLHKDFQVPALSVVLSFLLLTFSYLFWKLDQRNRSLIRISEAALIALEQNISIEGVTVGELKLFSHEKDKTSKEKTSMGLARNFRTYPLSYSNCLNAVFVIFASLGFLGMAVLSYQAGWWGAVGGLVSTLCKAN